MYINVAQLLKEPVGSTRHYTVDEYVGEQCENHVQGEVTLTKAKGIILVKGSMIATVQGICNRCLNPVDLSVQFKIEEQYFPSIDIVSGLPLPENPENYVIDESHVIDLSEALNQYTLMAMPMKILCKQDCAGICPSCGRNLNEGLCKCKAQIKNHRWSKLANLKKGE
jgi:uncharacterized protein